MLDVAWQNWTGSWGKDKPWGMNEESVIDVNLDTICLSMTTTRMKLSGTYLISVQGDLNLESQKSLMANTVYHLRLDLTSEFSKRSNIAFYAKVAWSQPDPLSPLEFVHGFQIVSINPDEQAIFERIVQKYGVAESKW